MTLALCRKANRHKTERVSRGREVKILHANNLTRNNVQFEKINEVFCLALLWFNTSDNNHDDSNSLPEVFASRIADLIMPKLKDQLDPK